MPLRSSALSSVSLDGIGAASARPFRNRPAGGTKSFISLATITSSASIFLIVRMMTALRSSAFCQSPKMPAADIASIAS